MTKKIFFLKRKIFTLYMKVVASMWLFSKYVLCFAEWYLPMRSPLKFPFVDIDLPNTFYAGFDVTNHYLSYTIIAKKYNLMWLLKNLIVLFFFYLKSICYRFSIRVKFSITIFEISVTVRNASVIRFSVSVFGYEKLDIFPHFSSTFASIFKCF